MLCEADTGYCSKFEVYLGKWGTMMVVLWEKLEVVRDLCIGFEHRGYKLYLDNYYTGVPLFLKLSEFGIKACGIIKTNQKFYPGKELISECKMLNQVNFHGNFSKTLLH